MCRSLHWVEFWWRQNKDFLRFLNKIKYSEKPTSKLNQSDDKVLTYWTSFLYNSKCVLPEKKITLSMKSHLVSFLRSFWHYKKKKLISTRCNSRKLSYPPLLIASLIEDITLTLLHTETITGQNYLMNLQPWQVNYSTDTPTSY